MEIISDSETLTISEIVCNLSYLVDELAPSVNKIADILVSINILPISVWNDLLATSKTRQDKCRLVLQQILKRRGQQRELSTALRESGNSHVIDIIKSQKRYQAALITADENTNVKSSKSSCQANDAETRETCVKNIDDPGRSMNTTSLDDILLTEHDIPLTLEVKYVRRRSSAAFL